MAVARRIGLLPADAEDCVQETIGVFLSQYSKGQYDRQKGRLRDWLCGILSHKARDAQRRHARERAAAHEAAGQIDDSSVQMRWRRNLPARPCGNVWRKSAAR